MHLPARGEVMLDVDLPEGDLTLSEVIHGCCAIRTAGFGIDDGLLHGSTSGRKVAALLAVDLRQMNTISTPNAPKPVAAYSQAVEANGFIFCAGQVGLDPATGKLAPDLTAQAEQVFANLSAVLAASGSGFDRAVKVSIFLVDLAQFSMVNAIYERHMGAHRPARTTVGCGSLPLGALIEVDVIAVK